MDEDQVARDVAMLAELGQEVERVWLPRLEQAREAAKRLEQAGHAGGAFALDPLGSALDERGPVADLRRSLRELRDCEGDELYLDVLCHVDDEPDLYRDVLRAGRKAARRQLRAMSKADRWAVRTWLRGGMAPGVIPFQVIAFYVALTGAPEDQVRDRLDPAGDDMLTTPGQAWAPMRPGPGAAWEPVGATWDPVTAAYASVEGS